MTERKRNLEITWPLFDQGQQFPEDPERTVSDFEPGSSDLVALGSLDDPPERDERAEREARRMRESLPPSAPEWMRAARALADWLELRISRGCVDATEEAAIARTWAAFSLGGITELELVKIAHVVRRAYTAIRESPRGAQDLQSAIYACAGVLHAGLPRSVRERMPLERVVFTVRRLREQADPWTALVDGTADLAGWRDYARIHAASVLRALVEKQR
jgi:hypothetical protein